MLLLFGLYDSMTGHIPYDEYSKCLLSFANVVSVLIIVSLGFQQLLNIDLYTEQTTEQPLFKVFALQHQVN